MDTALFKLIRSLVERPSVTGNEHDVSEWVCTYLEKAGFQVLRQPVSSGRFNIFARKGEPVVVFTSHLDTVPGDIPFSEDEKYVYGRGACDAKASVAAQIRAGELLVSEGVDGIGFLFLVGEEHGSDGAGAANELPNSCRFLIGGEPTDNKLATGSKGALRFALTAQGKTAHSAHPESGDSAILKLLDALGEVRSESYPHHPVLGATTFNIGILSGGIQANIVPDQARAEVFFRTVTPSSLVRDQLLRMLGTGVSMSVAFESDPFFFETAPGFDSTVVSFTTDMPLLSRWGKALLIGPGSILDAHTQDEKVLKSALIEGVEQYRRLVRHLMERLVPAVQF